MLLTERLLLRPAQAEDLHALHRIMSNPEAMQYWSTDPHSDLSQTEAFLAEMMAKGPDTDDFIVALRDAPDHALGKIGFWTANEAGLLLHPSVWRKGFAFEALTALLPRQFARHPDLPAILADIDPRNAPSIALFNKLGFVETGRAEKTYFLGGTWADSVYLTLPRPISV